MKKVIIVLALVALAIVPLAAKGAAAVGVELGQPTGITFRYDMDGKWDGYATVAFRFGSKSAAIAAAIGGEYKVTDFNIDKAKFNVNVGIQSGAYIGIGDNSGHITVPVLGTGSVSYDWTWKNVGDFTAYIRLGLGIAIGLGTDGGGLGFGFAGALGLVYHL
ncbi:MAG: hypothetical protein J5800_09665 [Spirochaetales bacterium]|nr:hypothetical protein [Spirochaetales bacterium]